MRATIISESGAPPVFGEFHEPEPREGAMLIDVDTAGLGGWDVLGAYRLGVGISLRHSRRGRGPRPPGRRAYFGERSVPPFGAWAERTLVPAEDVREVPGNLDDKTAISMGIAATGAIVPLKLANIKKGR